MTALRHSSVIKVIGRFRPVMREEPQAERLGRSRGSCATVPTPQGDPHILGVTP